MDWDALVFRAGDRVQAWGRLVRNAGGTWFDPPVARLLMLVTPRPVVQPSGGAG